MTILTSSATFTVNDGVVASESVELAIVPAVGRYVSNGRLVHPSIGTYDYEYQPDEFSNIDGDLIVPPIWSNTKTLLGAANTLFLGDVRDVLVTEIWNQELAGTMNHLRMLIAMWTNPPDPSVAYVRWFPTYISNLGFNVIMESLTAGGNDITNTCTIYQGWNRGPIVLKLRIAGRL